MVRYRLQYAFFWVKWYIQHWGEHKGMYPPCFWEWFYNDRLIEEE